MIDTHCHYAHSLYENDLDRERLLCEQAGIDRVICSPITFSDNLTLAEKTAAFSGRLLTFGIHPLHVLRADLPGQELTIKKNLQLLEDQRKALKSLEEQMQVLDQLVADHPEETAAIGETGIDVHTEIAAANLQMQKIAFTEHIRLALRRSLPLVLHLRGEGAIETAAELMRTCFGRPVPLRGTVHCFQGTLAQMKEFTQTPGWDFVFGIGGIITYKKRGAVLRDTLKRAAEENLQELLCRIVLETDAPFLCPEMLLNKETTSVNTSANLPFIAGYLADVIGVDEKTLIEAATANTFRVLMPFTA